MNFNWIKKEKYSPWTVAKAKTVESTRSSFEQQTATKLFWILVAEQRGFLCIWSINVRLLWEQELFNTENCCRESSTNQCGVEGNNWNVLRQTPDGICFKRILRNEPVVFSAIKKNVEQKNSVHCTRGFFSNEFALRVNLLVGSQHARHSWNEAQQAILNVEKLGHRHEIKKSSFIVCCVNEWKR